MSNSADFLPSFCLTENSEHVFRAPPEPVLGMAGDNEEQARGPRCECGGDFLRSPHSYWCPKHPSGGTKPSAPQDEPQGGGGEGQQDKGPGDA